MRRTAVFLLLSSLALPLGAQEPQGRRFTVGPAGGVLIPTGSQRDNFKTATMVGLQGGYALTSRLSLIATGAWTYGHHKYAFGSDRVDIWQYDAGLEFNPCGDCASSWDLHPLIGLGLGGRTNDYKAGGVGSSTCLAGYGALGLEARGPSLAVRLEGRDYLSCEESPLTGEKDTRNDVRITLGLGLRL